MEPKRYSVLAGTTMDGRAVVVGLTMKRRRDQSSASHRIATSTDRLIDHADRATYGRGLRTNWTGNR
eukprot:9678919-Lingulodinium_polyedra.AAC.1